MTDTSSDHWGRWATRWPRYFGVILLAAAAQSGFGAWLVSGGAGEVSRASLYYLSGCAVMAGVVGLVLCLAPLPVGRSGPPAPGPGSD
jgi:hypothetical protein